MLHQRAFLGQLALDFRRLRTQFSRLAGLDFSRQLAFNRRQFAFTHAPQLLCFRHQTGLIFVFGFADAREFALDTHTLLRGFAGLRLHAGATFGGSQGRLFNLDA